MPNNFRTSYTPQEIFGLHPKPDPPPKNGRVFWCVCVPLGALFGFIASLLYDSGGVFLPVWGVSVLLLWSVWESRGKK